VNSLPSKGELLAFQDRWLRRAGFAGIAGALVVAAAIVLQRVGLHLPNGDSDADQLVFEHAHHTRLIYTSVVQGIGFALFTIPLWFLFRSASGRAQRIRGALVGVVILGPLAFGLGLAVSSAGSSQAADDFTKQEPAVVQQARQQAVSAQATAASAQAKPKSGKSRTSTQSATATPTTSPAGTTPTGSTTTATGTTATAVGAAATPKTPDQAAHDAREGLADHLNRHTALLIVGGIISTIGVLALVFGMIYTSLWCMRLGLLTRFWGALGMAFGLFLVIPIFPPIPGLVLWFAVTGLMLAGLWPRPLPPAWAAGEAVPWQRPGDDLGPPPEEPGASGTVEGSGREVSDQAPERGGQNGEPPEPPYGDTQGQRRKKRKRRS
jgi:MFS family permease